MKQPRSKLFTVTLTVGEARDLLFVANAGLGETSDAKRAEACRAAMEKIVKAGGGSYEHHAGYVRNDL